MTRPARAEAEATHRAIALAEMADVPIYIVHLSAARALEMVTEARDRGLPHMRKRVRGICFSPTTTTRSLGSMARSRDEPATSSKGNAGSIVAGLAFNDLQAISTDRCLSP